MNRAAILKEIESQASGLDFTKLKVLKPTKEVSLQRTAEWFASRRFKFTSSCIWKLMTEPRSKKAKEAGELSETAKTYIMEKIVEDLGGQIPDFNSRATDWGEEYEGKAVELYTKRTFNEVCEVGFCQHTEFFGGSPDRLVCDNSVSENHIGGLEAKCPYNPVNHLNHCLIDSQEYFQENFPEYYGQTQSHCLTLGSQWCDFVSYDPRLEETKPDLALFIFRVKRDEDYIKLLLSKIEKALEYKNDIKKKLKI